MIQLRSIRLISNGPSLSCLLCADGNYSRSRAVILIWTLYPTLCALDKNTQQHVGGINDLDILEQRLSYQVSAWNETMPVSRFGWKCGGRGRHRRPKQADPRGSEVVGGSGNPPTRQGVCRISAPHAARQMTSCTRQSDAKISHQFPPLRDNTTADSPIVFRNVQVWDYSPS